jgi:ER membrane protein SH3
MYITVTIPSIRTVVTPVEGVDTREDQIEALRVLSAGNTLIIVLLGGVLALQVRELNGMFFFMENGAQIHSPFFFFFFRGMSRAPKGGQEWARRLEMKEVAKIAAEEAKEREGVKKDQ